MQNRSLLFPLAFIFITHSLQGQGSLTPPGAPAPTMKSLAQVEPRTPISSLPFTASTGGSYYLTGNLTTTGNGISVSGNDVTIDLNGFTISGDSGIDDVGIDVSGQRFKIFNGNVRNFSVGVLVGIGASTGLVQDMLCANNSSNGVQTFSFSGQPVSKVVFRRVRSVGNSQGGFLFANLSSDDPGRNVLEECEALDNASGIGFKVETTGNLIIRCRASGNAYNYYIYTGNRMGALVSPSTSSAVMGSTGGSDTGTTDPFANLSY